MTASAPDFDLAVCAELIFTDRPLAQRARDLHALGFQVEIWDWSRYDIDALAATGAHFSSMTGYLRGRLADAEGATELLRTAEQSIAVAARLGVQRLNLHGTGLGPDGLPLVPAFHVTGDMVGRAVDTLERLGDLGQRHEVTFVLENLNTQVDHPGTPFARAEDCLALVAAANHPNVRLMLDLYHAQIGEGNLIALIERCLPWIGEIQVADVPGRHEPGTGEINYPVIADRLVQLGYRGVVGLEAIPAGDHMDALRRFQRTFTPRLAEEW